jgi:uncharacterized membrane protein
VDEDGGVVVSSPERVTTLVAVAFPHESMASAAAEDVRWLALDVPVTADGVAVVSRDREGAVRVTTTHGRRGGTRWGVFWVLFVEALFENAPWTRTQPRTARRCVLAGHPPAHEETFPRHLRDMLTPRTSALFLAVDDIVSDQAVRELTRLGGVLVTWVLMADAEQVVQTALRGMTSTGTAGRLWPGEGGGSRADGSREASLAVLSGSSCGAV